MRSFSAVSLAATLAATSARADPASEHRGFYLRMNLGPGFSSMEADDANLTLKGAGVGASAAVGGALARNFVLFGEVFLHGMADPSVEGLGLDESTVQGAGVLGIGPGAAYYFMPLNLYVSATLALTAGFVDVRDELGDPDTKSRSTKAGLGLSLMVGKEWWLSANWGLGVAAQLFGARMQDEDIADGESAWRAGGFALLISGTYN